MRSLLLLLLAVLTLQTISAAEPPSLADQPANAWVKRTPLEGGPVSPRLGYEGACVWDSRQQLVVCYGGHNQGGGGEQGAEVWTFDLKTAKWTLKEPNLSPPGVCCNAQNIYDPSIGRYVRFPKFSGSHGWQWARELYLNDTSVWTYDLAANRWRNMRPLPTPKLAPYRAASLDTLERKIVVFGGDGSHEGTLVYDPWRNEWTWPKPANEPADRSGGNLAYDAENLKHILFGSQSDDDQHTWAYDFSKNEWRDMQPNVMPPTDKNDAVLTYDPVSKVVLAIVKITTGKDEDSKHEVQTWAYDAAANTWTQKNPATEPDAAGNRTRNLFFAPELNLAILENCTSKPREQQLWTYRYAKQEDLLVQEPARQRSGPPIVEDVVVSVHSAKKVEVTWQPPSYSDVKPAGYHVERAVVEVWSEDQLKQLKQNTPPLESPAVGALRKIGAFAQLTKEPVKQLKFVDESIDLAKPLLVDGEPIFESNINKDNLDPDGREYQWAVYVYRVRAINADGNVSGPSPAVFTIPSSPPQLFSQEDGNTCRLKWGKNPEQGLAGYRVYRLDGRDGKKPVSRLTPDAQTVTEFADEGANKAARRYHVLAVDALGQEGFPSSPVWYEREWKEFYKPFVGEWHQ